MIVLEHAHVVRIHNAEVGGIGVEYQLLRVFLRLAMSFGARVVVDGKALHHFPQVNIFNGLLQEVEGFASERGQHVLAMSRVDYYTARRILYLVHLAQKLEPRHVGQLYVKEYQVGLFLLHQAYTLQSIGGRTNQLCIFVLLQSLGKRLDGRHFVVDNDDFHNVLG